MPLTAAVALTNVSGMEIAANQLLQLAAVGRAKFAAMIAHTGIHAAGMEATSLPAACRTL